MNKWLPTIAFSVLLLVQVGDQNAFANHTPPGTGTTGHCDIITNPPAIGVNYLNCDLSGANFSGDNLSVADFSGANLSGANFNNAILNGANFSGADLSGASFISASLLGVNFSGANLNGANLSNANLSGADLHCINHPLCLKDNDGDLFFEDVDCNDSDPTIFPGAFEIPGDTIDQNCDGVDLPLTCGPGTILSGTQCLPDPNMQPKVCGQNTLDMSGICVPDLNQICGSGTMISQGMCIVEQMGQMVGGTLLELDNYALLVASIGTNPVITGLVGITLAGVAVQVAWFIHKKKNSNKS